MSLLDEVGDDIWRALEPILPERKKRAVAQVLVEVLQEYDADNLESTELYLAAFPDGEDDEEFEEDGPVEDEDF